MFQDWDLALPLFQEYLNFINPPWTLMLGKPESFINKHIENFQSFNVFDNEKSKNFKGYTGKLFGKYQWGSVPHPNARPSEKTRNEIWGKVIKEGNLIQK